jgi:hypothetical protein
MQYGGGGDSLSRIIVFTYSGLRNLRDILMLVGKPFQHMSQSNILSASSC